MLVHSAGESVGYGLLNEMLEEHRRLRQRGDFLIFPQLQLRWNPRNPRDLRSNLPDLGLGHLIPPDGHLYIQGGTEHKRPILPLMSGLPPLATVHRNSEAHDAFASAIKQTSDQMKVVIKNGAAPQDKVISWIISVCPYFIVKSFGPFNQAVLDTREHRPNPSGDVQVTKAIEKAMEQDRSEIKEPIHLICTAAYMKSIVSIGE